MDKKLVMRNVNVNVKVANVKVGIAKRAVLAMEMVVLHVNVKNAGINSLQTL